MSSMKQSPAMSDERVGRALKPFALISSEGVITQSTGYVTVTTCAEYFHEAKAALEALQPPQFICIHCDRRNDDGMPCVCLTADDAALIERLRSEEPLGMLSGCCDTVRLVNPDGPEAAARLTTLNAELSELRAAHDAAAVARDEAGYLGTVSDCIRHMDAELSERIEEVERLRGALEPFAKAADRIHEATDSAHLADVFTVGSEITVGDLRRARAALSTPSRGGR